MMTDSVLWPEARVGVDVPATPPDLEFADWMLWATAKTRRGVNVWPDGQRRYYCRQLTTGKITRAYADPDRAVAVVRRWLRMTTGGTYGI